MEPMLSVKQAAATLGISVSTLYRMVDEGTLRKLKVRNRTVFERAEVERYIQALRADAAAAPRATGLAADGEAKRAVVLLSGGLDSATALAIAKDQGFSCYAISFRYGQRHVIELKAAREVGEALGVQAHVEAEIDLRLFGGSALTADIEVPKHDSADELDDSVPITYVPARNTVFLSFALAWAETLQADDLFIGVNALDFSGYPDCRPDYIHAYQAMANLATVRGSRGPPPAHPYAADQPDEGRDDPTRRRPWRGLRADAVLLRPQFGWRLLRPVRLVLAAAARLRGERPD